MTEPLSPAAQAILAAVMQQMYDCNPKDLPNECWRVAYTLRLGFRALADELVPEGGVFLSTASAARIRRDLLAIATELENHEH